MSCCLKKEVPFINDLSNEFLRQWDESDDTDKVRTYDPYFMGEIVLSSKQTDRNSIDLFPNQEFKICLKTGTSHIR